MTEPHAGISQPDLIGAEDAAAGDGAVTSETDAPDDDETPVHDQGRPDAGTDDAGADLAEGRS